MHSAGLFPALSAVFVSLAILGICVLLETLVLVLPEGHLSFSAKIKSRAVERRVNPQLSARIYCLKRDLCNRICYKWIPHYLYTAKDIPASPGTRAAASVMHPWPAKHLVPFWSPTPTMAKIAPSSRRSASKEKRNVYTCTDGTEI